jgi:predicted nuclease of predicted toxin-antitoxin system
MKILIDMNLSPDWVEMFEKQGWQARHWSQVGNPHATDQEIMEWARTNG